MGAEFFFSFSEGKFVGKKRQINAMAGSRFFRATIPHIHKHYVKQRRDLYEAKVIDTLRCSSRRGIINKTNIQKRFCPPSPHFVSLLPFGPSLFSLCPSRTDCAMASLLLTFTGIFSHWSIISFMNNNNNNNWVLYVFSFDFGVFFYFFFVFALKDFLTSPAIKPHTSRRTPCLFFISYFFFQMPLLLCSIIIFFFNFFLSSSSTSVSIRWFPTMPAPPFSIGFFWQQSIQIQILLYMGQPQLHVLRVGMRHPPEQLPESAATMSVTDIYHIL